MKIKVCSIKQSFYDMFDDSVELEKNEKRPCLIIVRLKYRGVKCDFAIPFRSNISNGATRKEYFPLPPRKTTKKGKKHGLHYIKMFPIKKEYIYSYYSDNKENENDIVKVEKNIKSIVSEVQEYITNYENGTRYNFCTNIDVIFNKIYKPDGKQEVASEIDIKPKETENNQKSESDITE
ncbi:hypothetical protein BJV38_004789 [Clostridium beijerinckii]|uniref:hypothetical protein n=1 Tax=Clostridium beijerinckii TaxID=1520 RepID=UPI0015701CCB|nr:hypothetical protein [Clostridium beijerinckii]NRT32626.1 hypothetical protein [Clostridium beijerinckii]NRT47946.1 hypothetical protein [Clostridium beijerinckii]NRZ23758.1 hypothetical protein [Clostridium beijerinckii]